MEPSGKYDLLITVGKILIILVLLMTLFVALKVDVSQAAPKFFEKLANLLG